MQKCKNCGKVGHFAVKCRCGKSEKVNVNDVEEVFYINNVGGKDEALVPVTLNDTASVTFQIDTGSSAKSYHLKIILEPLMTVSVQRLFLKISLWLCMIIQRERHWVLLG